MQLPQWTSFMRRRPKDIKVKDFVDDKTKRDLVKMVGPVLKERKLPAYVTEPELLSYLSEPHSIQEVMKRFGYASAPSAYSVVRRRLLKGLVVSVGRGLYVATNANVTSFNIGDLSEQDLQSKGLETFQRHQNTHSHTVHASNKVLIPDDSPETAKYKGLFQVHPTKAQKQKLERAFLEYLQEPHSATEVAVAFGYARSGNVRTLLAKMERRGELFSYRGSFGRRVFQASLAYRGKDYETPQAVLEESLPEEVTLETSSWEDLWIETLAKRYIWENDIESLAELEVLKSFTAWVAVEGKE